MSKTKMQTIDTAPFEIEAQGLPKVDVGAAPMLKWLKIGELVVDPSYQRDVFGTGRKNILRIAREFDWSKFSTVIVAPVEGGLFAVVDGQHRTTAAALRGIQKVPCQVIVADRAKQAAAFAAINAVVTAMSAMQIHAAKVAAGDPTAVALNKACARAGVVICRYPIPANKMKVGETLAAGTLYRLLDRYGDEVLSAALACITKTGDGHPGLLSYFLIDAFCVVLEAEPDWHSSSGLPMTLKAINSMDLAKTLAKAKSDAEGSRSGTVSALVDVIGAHLDDKLSARAA